MKKFMLGILAVVVLFAFMPLNAQLMPEKKIEPVEPVPPKEEPKTEPKTEPKPDAKKYDLKVVYKMGMIFDRGFKMKIKFDMDQQGMAMNSDATVEFKLKNTVLGVKDNMPTDLKCEIKDAKVTGELPNMGMGGENNELEEITKLKGHWFRIKKNADGKFELAEKSKDFPEQDGEMFDDISESTLMMFDEIEFPKNPVAVGESFKFDYKSKMPSKDMLSGMTNGTELEEMKVKFDKVVEKDGVILGYFTGKVEQEVDMMGMTMKINIGVSMIHDISNNRCLKMEVVPVFNMGSEEFKMNMTLGMYIENNFEKVTKEEAPKVAPKDGE